MSPGQGRLILQGKKELWCVVACPCQAWWCTLVTLALGMSRQEDHRSEASLGYITGSVPEKDEGGGEEIERGERVKEGGKEKKRAPLPTSLSRPTYPTQEQRWVALGRPLEDSRDRQESTNLATDSWCR